VNCVTPAAVRTAIFDQMTQQHIEFMLSKIPLTRFGAIEEVTALICWLASAECSFSTGAVSMFRVEELPIEVSRCRP
jgi:3-oxoacyl-[acyl-carrier protein] reductase